MNEFKLSICLPVYNQTQELKRLLDSIAPQMTPEIEIIIRDDSTNDETKVLVDSFSKNIPIKFFHRAKEGVDKALLFLLEQAKGEFVWWIGDDDVSPDAIKKVLGVINREKEINFIWANYWIFNVKELSIDMQKDGFFKDRDELLEKAVVGLGFISACIFRRSAALIGLEESKKYINSEFFSLYIILSSIAQPGKSYYLRGPIVICYPAPIDEIRLKVVKKGGEIKNAAFEVFGVSFSEILKKFEGPFSHGAIRRTIKKSFGQTWRGMLVAWVGGWDTPKGKRLRMLKYFWTYPECWIALFFFCLPLSVNKILFIVYKVFFSNRRWVFGKK